MAVAGKVNETVLEERSADDEPLVFANKLVLSTCSLEMVLERKILSTIML